MVVLICTFYAFGVLYIARNLVVKKLIGSFAFIFPIITIGSLLI